ncbi:MAG TPA: YetF domain-containing protein [Dehalococcoidia bacterium]|nr:YetF domain-containing protein [Dehalococcoidia bacterium]
MTIDTGSMFGLQTSALELVLRTSLVYLGLLFGLRFISRRESGGLELPELLMVVLIADGVQNGMSGEYTSVTGAALVGGTILGWNFLLAFLAFRFAGVRRLIRPTPLRLVDRGRILRRNMRRELVTEDELRSLLRQQGVDDPAEVEYAFLEPDGALSVRRFDGKREQHQARKSAAAH